MAEMKTLTVNGKTYTVADPDSVSYGAAQSLTEEQQALARENIGAATIDDTKAGADGWSSKNIVDKLCPAFSESGTIVACQSVEGYPLGVVTRMEPVQAGEGDPSPENIRPITGHTGCKLWRGGQNLLSSAVQSLDNWVKETNSSSRLAFAIGELPEGTYTVSVSLADDYAEGTYLYLQSRPAGAETYTPENVNTVEGSVYIVQNKNKKNCTFIARKGEVFQLWGLTSSTFDTVKSIQLECGSVATAYEPYRGDSFTLDFGQTVYGGSLDWKTGVLTVTHENIASYTSEEVPDGWISSTGELSAGAQVVYPLATPITVQLTPQQLLALSGTNYLYSDAGDTAVEGRADPAVVVEQLLARVAALESAAGDT